jgi:hypothetical protein
MTLAMKPRFLFSRQGFGRSKEGNETMKRGTAGRNAGLIAILGSILLASTGMVEAAAAQHARGHCRNGADDLNQRDDARNQGKPRKSS